MKLSGSVEIEEKQLTPKISYRLIRLLARVVFVNKEHGLSSDFEGIVDTGAPLSVIPKSI